MIDESIFAAALAVSDPAERSSYLNRACAGNSDLRREVEELLAAHGGSNLLDRPPVDLALTGAYVPGSTNEEASASIGDRIGPYKLLEKIGEGGMGEVWVADQQEPIKRRVALKLIKAGMDSRSVLGRFEAERQALAVMDHPNIAKVLDAGTTKGEPGGVSPGRPYFVMELVKGTPITEFCDARKLTPKQRLELFIPVCLAIQHARMKGIIHRDIKPGNVLVALHDETPVAKVIDFGIAKAVGQQLTEKTIYTAFGALIGTPAYMAPEQATFNQLDIDTRADVYSLGVLLYELLAGSPPIEKERLHKAALDEILRIVRDEEPPRPSQRLSSSHTKASIAATRQTEPAKLSKLLRGEIDWIVMKSLEKDRNRRYETANALAKDVQRYLVGDGVEACPPTLGYRLRKAYRRNRAAVLVSGLITLVMLTAAMVSVTFGVQARLAKKDAIAALVRESAQRKKAETNEATAIAERERAEQTGATLRQTLYVTEMNLARDAWENNRIEQARELLRKQVPPPGQPDLRHFEWHYLNRMMNPGRKRWPVEPAGLPHQLSWSTDGTRLAVGAREVRDVATGEVALLHPRWGPPLRRQGRELFQEMGKQVHAFTPDGRWLVLDEGSDEYGLDLADPRTGEVQHRLAMPEADLIPLYETLRFSADGTRMSLSFTNHRCCVWDLTTRKVLFDSAEKKIPGGRCDAILSPDGKHLARAIATTGPGNGVIKQIQIWKLDPFAQVVTCQVPAAHRAMDDLLFHFSPDGRQLAYIADSAQLLGGRESGEHWTDNRVCVCDTETGKPKWWLVGDYRDLTALAWSADSSRVATGSSDGVVRVWEPWSNSPTIYRGQVSSVTSLAFSPDGKTLASLDYRSIVFLEVGNDAVVRTFRRGREGVSPLVAMSNDGMFLAYETATGDGLEVIEYTTGRVVRTIRQPVNDAPAEKTRLRSAKVAVSGQHLVTVDQNGRLMVHPLAAGGPAVPLFPGDRTDKSGSAKDRGRWPSLIRLSPDGRYLAANDAPTDPLVHGVGYEQFVVDTKVWDLRTMRLVRTFPNRLLRIFAEVTEFLPDGRIWLGETKPEQKPGEQWIYSKVWSLDDPDAEPEPRPPLPASIDAFHPATGLVLVQRLGRHDPAVFDWMTGRELFTISEGLHAVFSPDGRRLACFSSRAAKTGIRVWDTTTGQEVLQSLPLDVLQTSESGGKMVFTPDGRQLMMRGGRQLFIWDGSGSQGAAQ